MRTEADPARMHICSYGRRLLCGSIPYGVLLTRIFSATDPRRHGSSNIGASSVARVSGLSLWLSGWWPISSKACSGLPGLSGRLPFKGPKHSWLRPGLAGVLWAPVSALHRFPQRWERSRHSRRMALIAPMGVLIAAAAWAICVCLFRRVSIGSLAAAQLLPFTVYATIDRFIGGKRRRRPNIGLHLHSSRRRQQAVYRRDRASVQHQAEETVEGIPNLFLTKEKRGERFIVD